MPIVGWFNVKKLEKRYPGGSFSVEKSENRVKGDR